MKIAVLGCGIIGTTSAWWLAQAGHEVIVIERAPGPAQETSRANGGQISVSYAEPWANPQAPMQLLRWLLRDDAPLRFRLTSDPRQWWWGARFLRECLPARAQRNLRAMVRLAEYSRRTLQDMRANLLLDYDHLQTGILTLYRQHQDLQAAQQAADAMRDIGIDRRMVSPDELIALEPALAQTRDPIVGGDYTPDDESGDCHQFTVALARHTQEAGVDFRFNTQVSRLLCHDGRLHAVELIDTQGLFQTLSVDACVVALGSHTPRYVAPLGIACPVYPAKGYSATFTLRDPDVAPRISLIDPAYKVVYSRLGNTLRMAGTVELSGASRALNPARCHAMAAIAHALFPDALESDTVQFWSGLRPATPSSVPLIGRTRIQGLYLNTGHGALGWTMGAGSGKALADIVCGKPPEPEFPFLGSSTA